MIYSRLMTESAVDGAIQTPDDIGVDLDQVEKDIAGENGIAAHQDEVEDAQEGMIGDPVEEFAMIMYESEYNYNQIMESIGMAELREASMGRELIYESVDIKGFFEKVKKWLVSMFEKLTQAVRKLLAKLDFQAKADKKFVTQNAVRIRAGEKMADWAAEGYVFEDLKFSGKSNSNEIKKAVRESLDDVKAGKVTNKDIDEDAYLGSAAMKSVLKGIANGFGVNDGFENMEDFKEALRKKLFGNDGKKVSLNGKVSADDVIKCLQETRETTQIREAYENVKKGYKANLGAIKEWERAVTGSDENISTSMLVCQAGTRAIKLEQNAMHAAYGVYIQAAKAKRAQYRKLAHMFFERSKGVVKHEATSMFDAISMI